MNCTNCTYYEDYKNRDNFNAGFCHNLCLNIPKTLVKKDCVYASVINRKQPKNNFRTVCQCCGRIIKGNESKYAVQFQKYPLKEEFGYYVQGKKYSLCRSCLRSVELFIKKGGIMT